MPCNSSYLAARPDEEWRRQTAQLYRYALKELGREVPEGVNNDADNYYGGADYVPNLCKLLRSLTEDEIERIVYARKPIARRLADWWEEHQEADRLREEEEQKAAEAAKQEAEKARIRREAAKKMTPEEREAFGIKEVTE